jgi:toxin ParE1/3/4
MKIARLSWSRQAREELLDIYVMIGLASPAAAERLYNKIEAKVQRLARFPRLGPRRPEIGPSTRILIEGAYLILYETVPDSNEGPIDRVDIVRVIDGRRDLRQPF